MANDDRIKRALALAELGQVEPDDAAAIRAGAVAILGRAAGEKDHPVLDRLTSGSPRWTDRARYHALLDANGTSPAERRVVETALRLAHYSPEPVPRIPVPKLDKAIAEAGAAVEKAEAEWRAKVDALGALHDQIQGAKQPADVDVLRPALAAAADDLRVADQVVLRAKATHTALQSVRSRAAAIEEYAKTRRV